MFRLIVPVLLGYGVWTALWLLGNFGLGLLYPESQEAFESGKELAEPLYLAGALAWSTICSFVAGRVTARLTSKSANLAVFIMASLLLLTGIGVQMSVWEQMPLWYHLPFLLPLIPICVLGGRRRVAN